VLACCAAGPSGRLAAQQVNLNEWLNQRIDSAVAARLATRDGAKQAAVPVASGSDASLVDRAAMPDVVGISLTLPDPPASGSAPATTALSLSGTAYGLWAFLKGAGLTDTRFYLASKAARRIGISAAFDTNDSLGTTGLVQVKALVLDRGNPLTGAQGIGSALGKAGRAFGALKEGVQDLLFERVGKPRGQELPDFVDALAQPEVFANVLAAAGPEGLALIDRAILRSVAAFEGLRQQVGSAVAAARSRPELALGAHPAHIRDLRRSVAAAAHLRLPGAQLARLHGERRVRACARARPDHGADALSARVAALVSTDARHASRGSRPRVAHSRELGRDRHAGRPPQRREAASPAAHSDRRRDQRAGLRDVGQSHRSHR
jgi:hypothetical protein